MSETKLRGLAALSPERRKEVAAKAKATRAANKLKANAEPSVPASVAKDSEDKKLEHFRYTKDPRETAIWQTNPDLSPLHVPDSIRKKYPELEFGWLATHKMDKLGGAHSGWQVFSDPEFATSPEGTVKRMNDTVLGAMPKELKEKIDAAKQERAQAALLGLEETRVDQLEKLASAIGDPEAAVIINDQVRGKAAGTGIRIGRQRIANRPAMLRQRFIKQAEARSGADASKRYFDMGGK